MERIINIALVGHVSNGKTTLVNALTGINTKRSSFEKSSGRTVKLGYANCVLWECSHCKKVSSTSQDVKNLECCSLKMGEKGIISFVDAPGHHSYVQTMIKGATVAEGAILVTDVRKEPMQTQTTEHLAILTVLDVRNIIVVQNKADLVEPNKCVEHYENLKKELLKTCAEKSPIIPISAQNNINIDILRKLLLETVKNIKNRKKNLKIGCFQIVRSFDINKPGESVEKLKGGVLGGTVIGDCKYKIGDIVEIKPGIISKDKNYTPLKTEIISIFSETQSKNETTSGGLYGIGTKLDPCLTQNDRLVGNLLGKKEELPEIKTELEMSITLLKLDKKVEKIGKDKTYRLIIGTVLVEGVCKIKKGEKIKMSLNKPVCITENRCLIYNSENKLIAFGMFEDKSEEREKEEQSNIEQPEYNSLLEDLKIHEKIIIKLQLL
jgi:translation initiation factor 2 subunit 3